MKIKKGDIVEVLSGNDSGKQGEVLVCMPKTSKVIVKGVNIRKKHQKARNAGEESGIIEKEFPIDYSNVMIVCPKCGSKAKVGFEIVDGKKSRICKKCNAKI